MKPVSMAKLSLALLAALLLSGCASRYLITLNNGGQITTRGKPKLQGNTYVYKDPQGVRSYVPAGRVTSIMPASMAREETGSFRFAPSK